MKIHSWSMTKIIAVTVAGLVLSVVVGLVLLKLTNRPKTSAPVVTARHRPEATTAPPATPQPAAESPPQPAQPAPLPYAAAAPNPPSVAASTAPQPSAQPDLYQRLNALASRLDEVNARLATLEAQRSKQPTPRPGAKRPRSNLVASTPQRQRPTSPSDPAPRTGSAQRMDSTTTGDRNETPATTASQPYTIPGYKSLAIVSNRAWVAAPDGSEASVTLDEPLPQPRVSSMNPDTGVIVTTTQHRISPR